MFAYLHLLADTFCDRHSGYTPRLSASHNAILTVSVLVQELAELSGLSRAGFADDYDDLVLANSLEQVLAASECREVLSLFLQRPGLRKRADTRGSLKMRRELGVALIILLALFLRLAFAFSCKSQTPP